MLIRIPITRLLVRMIYIHELWYKDGLRWKWLAEVTTNASGYYQHWFFNDGPTRTYRSRHSSSRAFSNQTTITVTDNISAWNDYRPKVRYCQWTKLHGYFGGPTGPNGNTSLYMQRWSGSSWVWQATVTTDSSGYYAAWAPVCPTTKFRMAKGGSIPASAEVIKIGSTMTAWANSKVHAVLKDGYGDPIGSKTVYLQKRGDGGSSWAWAATGKTSMSGYAGFTPTSSGTFRVATQGSAVNSRSVAFSHGGKATMERVCSQCHGLRDTSGAELTPEGRGAVEGKESFAGVWMTAAPRDWAATVDRMKNANDCPMTDAEADIIVEYMDANIH